MKKLLTIVLIFALLFTSACNFSAAKETETSNEELTEVIPLPEASFSKNTIVNEKTEIIPVEATINSGSDFKKIEPLVVGKYKIKNTNISINVYNEQGFVVGHITDGLKSEYIQSPVLITTGRYNYIYGEGFNRKLNRIEYTEDGLKKLEEAVISIDLPEGVERATKGYLENGTLGESQTEDGKWKYAIYVEEEEMAFIITDQRLTFQYNDGLAISEDGNVYLIYYSSEPYTMELVKIEMPEQCNSEENFYIDPVWGDDCTKFGFSVVYGNSGKKYLIINKDKDVLARNGFENGQLGLKPLDYIPSEYEVIEIIPQNFEKYEICWEEYLGCFFLKCTVELDQKYEYPYDEYDLGITQNYLSNVIPTEELEDSYGMPVDSYEEALAIIERMKKELSIYEAEHVEEIKAYLQKYSYLVEEEASGVKEFYYKYGN